MDKEFFLESIEKFVKIADEKQAIVGFDGFVDNIIQVVDKRVSPQEFIKISSIKSFGNRILQASGKSTNIELVSQQVKMGGNGPLMASSMQNIGIKINYIGALGKNSIEPVFNDFANSCSKVYSITNPGYTQALEFNDGKIMLGTMNHLEEVNWQNILSKVGLNNLKKIVEQSHLIAFTNWTMLHRLNDIIAGFSKIIAQTKTTPYIFIDLADPQKRTQKDLAEILYIIKELTNHSKVIMGMNKKESEMISTILGIDIADLSTRADVIRKKLNLETVLLHSLKFAIVSAEDCSEYLDAPYEPKPLLTTGAGDNLNGGFCAGILAGLSPKEALTVGLFTTGFYVRKGYPPNKTRLWQFTQNYFSGE